MRTIVRVIDSISEWAGKSVRWLGVILVVQVTYEVTMRYVFNSPSLWGYELGIMLGGTLFVLAFAYTHQQRAHVRVDVIYVHLPPRAKATIDVLGDLLVFTPLIILLAIKSWDWAWYAWSTSERMPTTGWYPPAGPLRTMVLLGFGLLALQGVAQLVRDLHLLIRNKPYD
jgi:TRAP-type mannitol/chloroaromatic compound transport system permease small subunit